MKDLIKKENYKDLVLLFWNSFFISCVILQSRCHFISLLVFSNIIELQYIHFFGIIGVNLGKNKNTFNAVEDYLLGMEQLGDLSSYITINISSPNTDGLRDLQLRGNIENLIKQIVKKREQIESINKKPILIKSFFFLLNS